MYLQLKLNPIIPLNQSLIPYSISFHLQEILEITITASTAQYILSTEDDRITITLLTYNDTNAVALIYFAIPWSVTKLWSES
jgi:hypothetical protein